MIGQKGAPAVWGGVERHVEHLSSELSRRGHEVTIFARHHYVTPEQAAAYTREHKNISVHFLPTLNTKHLDAITHTFFATVVAMLQNVDVYHYHSVGPSLLSFLPRIFRPHATVVTTFHSPDRQHQKWGRFAKFMLTLGEWTAVKFSHQCITVSKELQRYALDRYGAQTYYVPNAVDAPVYADASMIQSQYGLTQGSYFVIVSRLIPHKGVHIAIEAFKKVPQIDKKLVIVGDASHTEEYVTELRTLAAGDERIIFTGFQHGRMLQELWSNAYASIHPSFSEGLSIALLEAASYGIPVISSDITPNLEVVGEYATTYASSDVNALAYILHTYNAESKAVQDKAKALRVQIEKAYTWNAVATSIESIYNERQQAEDVAGWHLKTLP